MRSSPSRVHVSLTALCGSWLSRALLVTLAATMLLVLSANQADAARRRRRGSSSAAAAAARKKQMIASLQKQLALAKQVLSTAESKAQMSQGEVDKAVSELSQIRTSLEADEEDMTDASKSLNELEADILEKQSFGSEYKLALQSLQTAKEDLHALIHKKFPGLPAHSDMADESARLADLAAIAGESRTKLNEDEEYQSAAKLVESLARKVAQVRQKLFAEDPQWELARKEVADATRKVREERAQASATGIGSLDDRHNLRTAQGVAAAARGTIAQCEMMLARLGAKPAAPTAPKKSQSSK